MSIQNIIGWIMRKHTHDFNTTATKPLSGKWISALHLECWNRALPLCRNFSGGVPCQDGAAPPCTNSIKITVFCQKPISFEIGFFLLPTPTRIFYYPEYCRNVPYRVNPASKTKIPRAVLRHRGIGIRGNIFYGMLGYRINCLRVRFSAKDLVRSIWARLNWISKRVLACAPS